MFATHLNTELRELLRSAGTVAGTGLIRKPSGERGATYSRDKRKSPFRLNVGGTRLRDNRSARLASHLPHEATL